ncbi:uncharacterized protein N7473_011905 [Penicillium subrubescens]|uniref:Uncharacterized protein n=1 Tax=Penicillium subrubescens TaxID=1316194 RepID=A0A1Q5UPI4_9EURO|nr:uncharacterized protein N7473_011905 [Penicillium subrubescens]KAJ5880852.1 hypothetical protein N7473_011905 [Penicillium subrubescens]OKP14379.1 hypothetical protein PENSUB_14158 [Penicillium subrubescens]
MGRLHRDDLADAASSHSLHSIADDDELPPPYTDEPDLDPVPASSAIAASSSRPTGTFRPLRIVDAAYAIPGTKGIHSYDKRVVTLAPNLSSNKDELFEVIRRQLNLPVRPMLLIQGTHSESSNDGKQKKSNTVTDFEFRLDLAETMLTGWEGGPMHINWMEVDVIRDEDGVSAFRGGILRSRAYKAPKARRVLDHAVDSDAALLGPDTEAGIDFDGEEEEEEESEAVLSARGNLKLWCERFCLDPAHVKSFTIYRELRGFDHQAMRNILDSHIRELNYRGTIKQHFTQAHSSVTVYSPHWINRARTNKYIWWIVVLLQLWIITWPVIWLMEKRYEIAFARWNASLDPQADSSLVKCYAQHRNESALAEWWAPAVKQAAWTRRSGDNNLVTRLDAERMMGMSTEQLINFRPRESEAELERRGRVARGEGGFVDNVVGLARGISEVGQDWRFTMGWGANT